MKYTNILYCVGESRANVHFKSWENDPLKSIEVVPFVKSFTQRRIFELKRADIVAVRDRMGTRGGEEHALWGCTAEDQTLESENFKTPWAYCHLFYKYIEDLGSVPSWQEWRRWQKDQHPDAIINPIKQEFCWHKLLPDEKKKVERQMRWRIGNAYYGLMRELEVFVRLREMGYPVKYHVLADALFGVDFWCGDRVVEVYVANKAKKDGEHGRKSHPSDYLDSPPFSWPQPIKLKVEKNTGRKYGWLYFADDESVKAAASELQYPSSSIC